jgi:hypothetical protein
MHLADLDLILQQVRSAESPFARPEYVKESGASAHFAIRVPARHFSQLGTVSEA